MARLSSCKTPGGTMNKRILTVLAAGLLVMGFNGFAFSLALTDVTMDYDLDKDYDLATAFFGPTTADNDDVHDVNSTYDSLYGSGEFTLLAKSDIPSDGEQLNGFDFNLAAVGNTTGEFNLSWSGGTTPAYFDFVFAVKASTQYGLYIFDNIGVFTTPSGYLGQYAVNFKNNGGSIPDMSHISVYGRTSTPTPEPATMLLFGAGLAGLAGIARRKKPGKNE
jgi:hypothetical protein